MMKDFPKIASLILFQVFLLLQIGFGQEYQIEVASEQKVKFRHTRFNAEGNYFVTSEDPPNNHVKLWDANNFELLQSLPIKNQKIEELAISSEGRYIAVCIKGNEIKIWDTVRKKIIADIGSTIEVEDMQFQPYGNALAACGYFMSSTQRYGGFGHVAKKNVVDLFTFSDADSLGIIRRYDASYSGEQGEVLDYSDNGQYILCANRERGYDSKNIQVWSTKNRKLIYTHTITPLKSYPNTKFVPNTNWLVYSGATHFYVLDYLKGKEIAKVQKKVLNQSQFDINTSGHILYPAPGGFEITDLKTQKVIQRYPMDGIWLMQFHASGKLIMLTTMQGTIKVLDYQNNKLLFELSSMQQEDGYLLVNPEGYYFGSKTGVANLVAKRNEETINYESIDLEYNRPDLVLSGLPTINPLQLQNYAELVKERQALMQNLEKEPKIAEVNALPMELEEIGLPIVFFDAPELSVIKEQKGHINLSVRMKGLKVPIKSLSLKVNSNPVLEKEYKDGNIITEVIPLQLSHGENLIEAIVENQSGKRSLPQQLILNHQQPDFTQKICFFGVGVSAYKEEKDLEYAHKDVEDVARFLEQKAPSNIKIETKLLTNNKATLAAIQALKNELQKTSVDDIVILYFAGHGRRPKADQEWCFKPFDYTADSPGLTDAAINDLIQESPSRKKIVVLDACYAGEFAGTNNNDSLVPIKIGDGKEIATRGADEDEEEEETLEAPTIDRIKSTFNDLRNSSGAIVIAASGAKEQAIESPEFSNGVFTYHFLQGLESIVADSNFDRQISVAELMAYVHDQISETYGQQPNFKRKYAGFDFVLWNRTKKQIRYDQLFDKD